MIVWCNVALAQNFPYGAKVRTKSATVRSGPGAKYYHTDRLPFGSRVEVYRHDDDWAAIRPPKGSYSWIPASAVELSEDTTIGHVVTEGVRTRIGSRFGDEHKAHYISLHVDEMVEVIGRRSLIDAGAPSLWYQIKPPAGEFRWVQQSSIESLPDPLAPAPQTNIDDDQDVQLTQFIEDAPQLLSPEATSADKTKDDGNWTIDAPDDQAKPLAIANVPTPADPVSDPPVSDSPPAFQSIDDVDKGDVVKGAVGTAKIDPLSEPNEPSGFVVPSIDGFRPRATITDPGLLRQELAKINAEISRQIVKDPSTWELSDFRARTQAIIDLSSTNDQRGKAQALLSRITQFRDIQRRHQNLVQGATQSLLESDDLANRVYSDLPITPAPPTATSHQSQTAGSAYDGTGWLMPIVTQHPGLPRYALTDDNGNILQFVSPLPGLNLSNYERRRIAIIGRKGFVPRFNKVHLTAERIISLDRVRF